MNDKSEFQNICLAQAEKYGIRDGIKPDLLCLCLEIPEDGVRVIHHTLTGILTPLVYCEEGKVMGLYSVGRYNMREGVLVFVNNDGRTFFTCDRAVLGALQQAGYLRDGSLPVSLPREEVMMGSSDLWHQWKNIVATGTL